MLTVLWAFLIPFSSTINITTNGIDERQTPSIVDERIFPFSSRYDIKVRVVVEYLSYEYEKDKVFMMLATKADDIVKEIDNCNKIFETVPIRLVLDEISYQRYDLSWFRFFIDAIKSEDHISIYYLLPHDFPYSGLSSAPWEELPFGILLASSRDDWTLAHEVGHYFGLLHIFGTNDYCEDTPTWSSQCECPDDECGEHCGNIMNYCDNLPKTITDCQVERMRRFLRSSRRSHVVKSDEKRQINIQQIYETFIETITKCPEDPGEKTVKNNN